MGVNTPHALLCILLTQIPPQVANQTATDMNNQTVEDSLLLSAFCSLRSLCTQLLVLAQWRLTLHLPQQLFIFRLKWFDLSAVLLLKWFASALNWNVAVCSEWRTTEMRMYVHNAYRENPLFNLLVWSLHRLTPIYLGNTKIVDGICVLCVCWPASSFDHTCGTLNQAIWRVINALGAFCCLVLLWRYRHAP